MRGCLVASSTLVLALLLLGSSQAAEVVGQEPFSGNLTGVASAPTIDVDVAYGGSFALPAEADEVRVELAWERSGQERPLRLTITDEGCQGRCDTNEIASRAGTPPITVAVPSPSDGTLGWQVTLEDGRAVHEGFTGRAVYLADRSDSASQPTVDGVGTPSTVSGSSWGTSVGLAVGLTALTAGAIATRRAFAVPRWIPAPILGLFHRKDGHELLEHPTRSQIHATVADEPGIHFEALSRRVGLGHGALEHHLARMAAADLLVDHRLDGYRGYFLPGEHTYAEKRAFLTVRAPGARSLLQAIASRQGMGISALAHRADLSVSTASYHADRLTSRGLVERDESGRSTRLSLTALGATVARALAG